MKIALLWPYYWPYVRRGGERMVHDHAVYLASRGHTVHILASKPGPGSVERKGLITIYRFPEVDHPLLRFYADRLGRYYDPFDAHSFQVLPLLLRERYDLLHLFIYHHGPSVRLVERLRGMPWAYHILFIPPYAPRAGDQARLCHCLRDGVPVRVFSRYCAEHIRQEYGVPSVIIPPTVDTTLFHPLGPKDTTRPKILFTADLSEPRKGAEILVRAFNEVHRACPRAVLQLAGPIGFQPAGVKQLLGLVEPAARSSVEVLDAGALKDVPQLYRDAALTVLPSLDEAFGMVISESLASGTPVVGADSGALPELIDDPSVGSLFARTGDTEESAHNLAVAILHTLEVARDPAVTERCRQHAQRWTWSRVGPAFDAYQEAAQRGPAHLRTLVRQPTGFPAEIYA